MILADFDQGISREYSISVGAGLGVVSFDLHSFLGDVFDDVQRCGFTYVVGVCLEGQAPDSQGFIFYAALVFEIGCYLFCEHCFLAVVERSPRAETSSAWYPFSLAVEMSALTSFGKQEPP